MSGTIPSNGDGTPFRHWFPHPEPEKPRRTHSGASLGVGFARPSRSALLALAGGDLDSDLHQQSSAPS